jgi:peptide/nickel transport system substrate-binding protein
VRSPYSRLLLSIGLIGLLPACGAERDGPGAGGEVPEAERYGGTAVVSAFADLVGLNALVISDYNSNLIMREMLFMPLIKYDENLRAVPWLAERVDTVRVSADTLEVTFHLRRDVFWHDGQPTTARDVVFSFDRMVDPNTAFPNMDGFDLYEKQAELVDDYTVRFRLQQHAEFLDIWFQTAIMPAHVLEDVPPNQLLQHRFSYEPVGNGPFRFARRVAGQEWVFDANPDFPQALGGRPYLDRVVFRTVPEPTTLLTELLTGRSDVFLSILPSQTEAVRSSAHADIIDFPFRMWVWIGWNTRLPMFASPEVRRALTMAIDREQLVEALTYGYADVGRSSVTPGHWSYDPDDDATFLPYDTAGARRLLEEAGWRRNAAGMLVDDRGRPFRFSLRTNHGNDTRKEIIEYVQAQLRPLGIQVDAQLVEWNTLVQQLQNREFEAVVSAWADFFRKDDASILHSRNLDQPYQYVGYANPRADLLIDSLAAVMDRREATRLWREWQRFFVQESPYTVLYYPRRLNGVATRLQGVHMDTRGELISVTRWWIPPAQRRGGAAGSPVPADTAGPSH